jgi:hypothetical protein
MASSSPVLSQTSSQGETRKTPRLDQQEKKTDKKREKSQRREQNFEAEGWTLIDKNNNRFTRDECPNGDARLLLKYRNAKSGLEIFKDLLEENFLRSVWEETLEEQEDVWNYGTPDHSKTINSNKFSLRVIYSFFAVKMRIHALQKKCKASQPGENLLIKAIKECRSHFGEKLPGKNILQTLLARYLLTENYFARITDNIMSIIRRFGEFVAGDEKLLHFTGNSGDIRMVRSKPDRVGLWFYELCALLPNGLPIIVYFRLQKSDPRSEETIKTKDILEDWADVIQNKVKEVNPHTKLVCDSYYGTEAGFKMLNDRHVAFVAAIQASRFEYLAEQLGKHVQKPGDWHGFHRSLTSGTHEIVILHDDKSLKGKGNKRKFVYSNAYNIENKKPKYENIIPVYDDYAKMFSSCDQFNKDLHGRT